MNKVIMEGVKEKLPPGWQWVKLLEIVDRIAPGKLFDRESCKPDGKVPVVDQSECGFMGFHNESPGVMAFEEFPIVTFANHTCAVRLHTTPFSVIQNVFPLSAREGVDPFYVYWVLRGRLPATFYGGHWPKLVKIKIPLPPFTEQQRIALVLREQMAAVEKARVASLARLTAVKDLPVAYLRQIFPRPSQPLPNGWRLVKLGEVFNITSSKRVFESDWKREGVPFYRAREIVKLAEHGFVDNELFISEKMFNDYSAKYGIPEEGDIMVTGVGTLGVCYIVRKHDKFYFKDGNIIWLQKKADVDSSFVEYAFRSDFLREQIDNAAGATIGTFTIIKAKNTQIPLPPLTEQRRIVGQLRDHMMAVEKARAAAEEELQTITTLPASLLCRVFNGEI